MVLGTCAQVRGRARGTVLARPYAAMDDILHDETETKPILMAPLVTIATTLVLVILTALFGH